ncbi:glycerophosphoryl diester phosphodiesterase membrane domain-containing protein [Streptomyces sp. KN37]|uniref:glycerophosphoryl diester phosphodiesterase membrane domain-containing protein n=1 Tax=Streptomyces sp. KN37 TaxID=3090667 RepID=UPI002A75545D|nr:glycerophosphoryl diester phosphodiesterase membrane domain-containing protein [Streptomyces sp. KN37]WPO73407.1 glycerophosphoryl diester phosphodiesterase membrane domain-containing protein [Streptomyces sp. KN37]
MNDTPGWASPGSAPSDGQDSGKPDAPEPADAGRQGGPSKWSKEQPPPAQWSPPGLSDPGRTPPPPPPPPGQGGGWGWGGPPGPGAPGPGGPGGPGGYRGWGAWQGPPPAAKPGVIPLRPLGIGEILDGAVSTMRAHWRTVLGISLTVAVLTEIVIVLLQGLVLNESVDTDALNDPSATVGELTRALGDTMLNSGVVLVITLLGTIVATALLTMVTSRAVLGKPVTITEAWRDSRPRLAKLFGLTLLIPLIGAAVIAVGILPGVLVAVGGASDAGASLAVLGGLAASIAAIWIVIRFSLASPALMLEKQGVKKSLTRSAKLVHGSWWRVFGIQLLAAIIANVVASIIVIPFTFLAGALSGEGVSGFLNGSGDLGWTFLIVSGVGSVIGSMLTFPITAGVTVLLYIDQRIRREALDLELTRAAGIPGQGSNPPGTPGS